MTDYVEVHVYSVRAHGNMAIGEGFHEGDEITFSGDRRPMADIARAIEQTDAPVVAMVPTWAILERRRVLRLAIDEDAMAHYFG